MKSTLISIIIPVFNAERYLNEALNSVFSQLFQEWECLLIDDGSTDNSGNICDSYAKKDSRFIVIHKTNGGVSSARNEGLRLASGDWIAFMDADDTITNHYLSDMVSSKADMVMCGFTATDGTKCLSESRFLDRKAISEELNKLVAHKVMFVPWCKLIRREIISTNSVSFNEALRLAEDTMFMYDCLSYCNTLEFINNTNYIYRGEFGGGNKYQLTWDEMAYRFEIQVSTMSHLRAAFGVSQRIRFIRPAFVRVKDLLQDYTASECFRFWQSMNSGDKEATEDFFFGRLFELGSWLIANTHPVSINYYRLWQNFVDVDTKWIRASSFCDRTICFFYKIKLYFIAYMLLKLKSAIHYIKNR